MTRSALPARFWSIALAALLPLAGCSMTSTYGTGEAPEMALFREMIGRLLDKNKKKPPIDYQPRAPLVMPPDGRGSSRRRWRAPKPPVPIGRSTPTSSPPRPMQGPTMAIRATTSTRPNIGG